jgi:transcriptional regulator with PAS, ATPase and Fis domain
MTRAPMAGGHGTGDRPTASPSGRLRAVHPPDLTWVVECGSRPLTIGSVKTTAPPLDHEGVAPHHLGIRYEPTHLRHVARDLGGGSTRIDGVALHRSTKPLQDGTVIRLGDVYLVYELGIEVVHLKGRLENPRLGPEVVPGRAPIMQALRATLAEAAENGLMLIEGEPGTGKQRIARELHRLGAPTSVFEVIPCADASRGDLQAVLRATDATIVLDEVLDLDASLQLELANALQRRPPALRIVATSVRSMRPGEGRHLRPDLLQRLSRSRVCVPPLRHRRGDIVDWLDRLSPETPPALSPEAVEPLLLAPWPDNLHGLIRFVDACSTASRPVESKDLPIWTASRDPSRPPRVPSASEFVAAFEQLDGNVSALARRFARNRRQIYRWIEKHGLK